MGDGVKIEPAKPEPDHDLAVIMNSIKMNSILSFLFGIVVLLTAKCSLVVNDPQSDGKYWVFGYSLLLLVSFAMGMISIKPWLWPVSMISAQLFASFAFSKGDLNQMPIGIVVHVIILIPCLLLGYLGCLVGNKKTRFPKRRCR